MEEDASPEDEYSHVGHQRFPSIRDSKTALHNAKYRFLSRPGYSPSLSFTGTPKMHGTNSAIRFEGDKTFYQSREKDVSYERDNYGFFKFCAQHSSYVEDLRFAYEEALVQMGIPGEACTMVVYGELCGKGTLKGSAISQLPKRFIIFGARLLYAYGHTSWFDIQGDVLQPGPLEAIDCPMHCIEDYDTLYHLEVDLTGPASVAKFREDAELLALTVEAECPVAAAHGVVGGIGEGIVWKCDTPGYEGSRYWFKTKGEKHKAYRKTPKIQTAVDMGKLTATQEFVACACSESRLNQGIEYLKEMGHPILRESTPHYLRWVANDVKSEHQDEMIRLDLEWKLVAKTINTTARMFLFGYISRN